MLSSQNMQLHAAVKPSVQCSHLVNTNEELSGLASLPQQFHLPPNYFCVIVALAERISVVLYSLF